MLIYELWHSHANLFASSRASPTKPRYQACGIKPPSKKTDLFVFTVELSIKVETKYAICTCH